MDDLSIATILRLCDAGKHPGEIAAALDIPAGRVYAVLREHRPDRKRKPRAHTSVLRSQILALAAIGTKPARIAMLLNVTRQYVYKVVDSQHSL